MSNAQKESVLYAEELKKTTGEDGLKSLVSKIINALSEAEKQIESAEGIIAEQSAEVEKAKVSNPFYRPTTKLKTGTYQINHAVRGDNGLVIPIDEIAGNVKLVEQLIKSGSTAVSKLIEE